MEYSLNDLLWEVKGFWPWVPLKGTSMEIGNQLMGVTDWLPATVSGGVHHDLYNAGLIDNPYRDLNSLKCEWVENRWWVYRTTFKNGTIPRGDKVELVCKGLDYEAIVYLNGTMLGEHEGMYHPAVFDVTDLLKDSSDAELMIVLKHAPDEMGQIGKTSATYTQKSRFNYKWDFSTRLVNLGIWDDVVLRVHQAYGLEDIALHTNWDGEAGIVRVSAAARRQGSGEDKLALEVTLSDPDGSVVAKTEVQVAAGSASSAVLRIDSPQLWYPNGYGEQPLYRVRLQLRGASTAAVYDEKTFRTGIRSLSYVQNDSSPEGALPYTFVVNGTKIYIKGANMTPLDHLYGNIALERYEWMVLLAKHANMNMIRVWGGGIIEKPCFYELCDRHGILIWQEFIQSSSGIDNEPSKRPEFVSLLEKTAVTALQSRRNHVSLAVWSGGNELMSEPNKPSTYEDTTIGMLKALVAKHDPERLFLPTSASGPVQYITEEKGVSHDVHGHWKYQGNPDHYRIYGNADHLFHSEFGVDGLSSVRSLRKFLSEPYRTPVSMQDSIVWRHHGEWWDTYDRDRDIFGEEAVGSLEAFSRCSQWMQAEGLRYILEANRRRKFSQSGSLIWQLNEPWPNVTCTNLVDYYEELKMAYYWVRRAFAPVHVSMDYRKLHYEPGKMFEADLYVHADGQRSECVVMAQMLNAAGELLLEQQFEAAVTNEQAVRAGTLRFAVPADADTLFFVRLNHSDGGGLETSSLYTFSTAASSVYGPAKLLDGSGLVAEPLDEWSIAERAGILERTFRVTNTGTQAVLHIHPVDDADAYRVLASDAYFSLFPGEEATVKVNCQRKAPEVFAERNRTEPAGMGSGPDVRFEYFSMI